MKPTAFYLGRGAIPENEFGKGTERPDLFQSPKKPPISLSFITGREKKGAIRYIQKKKNGEEKRGDGRLGIMPNRNRVSGGCGAVVLKRGTGPGRKNLPEEGK